MAQGDTTRDAGVARGIGFGSEIAGIHRRVCVPCCVRTVGHRRYSLTHDDHGHAGFLCNLRLQEVGIALETPMGRERYGVPHNHPIGLTWGTVDSESGHIAVGGEIPPHPTLDRTDDFRVRRCQCILSNNQNAHL
ncbi:hypothetical protein D3C76_1276460 [compost metagenome]